MFRLSMLSCFVFLASAVGAQTLNEQQSWANFKEKYGRQYSSAEEDAERFGVFVANMARAEVLMKANPLATFGENEFADMTADEFKSRHNCTRSDNAPDVAAIYSNAEVAATKEATRGGVDWRAKGAVTEVKNQGSCGSCWAFETVGNIEGVWFLAGNKLTSISAQELVSCQLGDLGCQGGRADTSMKWIISDRKGVMESEEAYPYTSAGGGAAGCGGHLCKAKSAAVSDAWCISNCYSRGTKNCPPSMCDCNPSSEPVGAKISGWKAMPQNEDQIATYLVKNGPVAVAVAADSWSGYKGGIMTNCRASTVDHGVLLVGYGTDAESNSDYWIIKNSWGANWGESGFIRIQKGSNQCNVKSRGLSATA